MPRRTARPWLVDDDERLTPAGRPRSGPRGLAVRALPRLTVRAERPVIRLWLALTDTDERPGFELFREMVRAYVGTLPAGRRAEIERRARALAREDRENA